MPILPVLKEEKYEEWLNSFEHLLIKFFYKNTTEIDNSCATIVPNIPMLRLTIKLEYLNSIKS